MKKEEGYYLATLAGCSDFAIFWCDGEDLFAPGTSENVTTDSFVFISKSPIDLTTIQVDEMILP